MAAKQNTDANPLQTGSITTDFSGSDPFDTQAITFPNPYGAAPDAVLAIPNNVNYYCTVDTITATGFNLRTVRADATNPTIHTHITAQWLAYASPGK